MALPSVLPFPLGVFDFGHVRGGTLVVVLESRTSVIPADVRINSIALDRRSV